MAQDKLSARFSRDRLGGDPVPDDLRAILPHRDELAERTGIELHLEKDWVSWLDTSYLSETERANPDVAANVRAIAEVCQSIAFVAVDDEDQYLGYWRGPGKRKVADCPLVLLDNEGQFELCAGTNFAETVLSRMYDEEAFDELKGWFADLGIEVEVESADGLEHPDEEHPPDALHEELYRRYRGEA